MAEDGFFNDRLTLLVLQDVTLFGNSAELEEFDKDQVLATRDKLLLEKYAKIVSGGKSLRGDDVKKQDAPRKGVLTEKGQDLRARIERKLKV